MQVYDPQEGDELESYLLNHEGEVKATVNVLAHKYFNKEVFTL